MIKGFFKEYRFLSNFHYVNVEFEGMIYCSTEHAYQAAKTLDLSERKMIQELPLAKDAKKAGMNIILRPNWDNIKFDIMLDLTRKKYANEPLKTMLLNTGEEYLEETNYWHDNYYGFCTCEKCNGSGQNNLGKIIMKVRNELSQ